MQKYAHLDRYLPMVRDLAAKALDMAVDGSPTRPRQGERVVSLMLGVPAARKLLGAEVDLSAELEVMRTAGGDPNARFTDGVGNHRKAYWYLLMDLYQRFADDPLEVPKAKRWEHEQLWQQLIEYRQAVSMILWMPPGEEPEPLHEQTLDDAPEDWTYRELVGLHALLHLAVLHRDSTPLEIAKQVALYHQHHTQPDYTTYQPWGLPAFLAFPETIPFAEQQLHDVTTHLALEGGPGALLPGLLLADTVWALEQLCGRE